MKGEEPDCDYEMTKEQLQDIITCAASKFIRDDFTMKAQYTYMKKDSNY